MSQLTIELSDPAMRVARAEAAREAMSVEAFIVRRVEQEFAEEADWARRVERANKLPSGTLRDLLRNAPYVPPIPGDEIE